MDTSFLEFNLPKAQTRVAIEEREAGKKQKFSRVNALIDDVHADGRTVWAVQSRDFQPHD